MTPPLAAAMPTPLDRRPEEAIRLVALDLLAQADAAHARFGRTPDPEALHDFRVALRRLRTMLRAFDRELASSVSKRVRRRIRKLASATNEGRDAEVQLDWVERERKSLYSRHRPGAARLLARLRDRRETAYGALVDEVSGDFVRLHRKLAHVLATYDVTLRVGDVAPPPRFAETLVARVREAASTLARRLESIATADDAHALHRARIAAKRLRYLLETAAPTVDRAAQAVKSLKRLQDALGRIHDLDVLGDALRDALDDVDADEARPAAVPNATPDTATDPTEPRVDEPVPPAPVPAPAPAARLDPRPGLVSLARRAQRQRGASYDTLATEWLHGAAAPVFAAVESAAQAIGAPSEPGPIPGSPTESEPLEIERKYLLATLPEVARGAPYADIEQGWLPGERLVERVRRAACDGTERFYRTVKSGVGLTRIEIEEETTRDVFSALWPLTRERRIAKRRYLVPDGDATWEIDDFGARGLVVAEIELPSADAAVELPAWLAPHVVREVTDDPSYTNFMLAGRSPAAG